MQPPQRVEDYSCRDLPNDNGYDSGPVTSEPGSPLDKGIDPSDSAAAALCTFNYNRLSLPQTQFSTTSPQGIHDAGSIQVQQTEEIQAPARNVDDERGTIEVQQPQLDHDCSDNPDPDAARERCSGSPVSQPLEDREDRQTRMSKYTLWSQIRATMFNSWINVLFVFSPIGIALYYAHINPVAVFIVNFIAIIPLAAMLSFATEELALRVGDVLGGLLNASFGNAVELIVSIIALAKDEVLIVQTSLIGSMLSNLLLVMGMCFFFGGFNRLEQAFNLTVAQTASSLLFLAVSGLIIPTVFAAWAGTSNGTTADRGTQSANLKLSIAALSRGTAVLLLIVYGCYLFFQLKSHADIYNTP
ncbi:hypothetical protein LTR72_012332, partial [Exophiala xenobiotica]